MMESKFKDKPGSRYASKINYPLKVQTFRREDIPEKSLKAKLEVQESLQSKRLGKKPQWNSSTLTETSKPKKHRQRELHAVRNLFQF